MNPDFLAPLAAATVGLLQLMMACAAWLMLRGPRHARTVQLWAAGTLALGVSLALGGLAHPLPPHLPVAVQQGWLPALVLAALLLRVLALRRHMGRPLHLGAGATLAAGVALGWLACLQSEDPRVPASYANAVLILGTAIIGQHAWEDSRSSGAATARWVAWAEWLLTAALALRAIAIAAAAPVAVALLVVLGPLGALPFAIVHGLGNGLVTIVRGTLPLALFGATGYGVRQGWLTLPARLLGALSPWLFGLALARWGLGALWLSAALALVGFAGLALLRLPSVTKDTPTAA